MSGDNNSLAWRLLSGSVCHNAGCVNCGSHRDLLAHHKIPRAFGGRDIRSNLEPVCRRCHPTVEKEAVERAIRAGLKRRVRVKRTGTPTYRPDDSPLKRALAKPAPKYGVRSAYGRSPSALAKAMASRYKP